MPDIKSEIEKRRTFAIISHPDAGKTTLTEKFLLYGGAINLAGSVKGKKTAKHAVSDWMEIEKERGISVTSSVLQFNYGGYCINILDTPGHEDFSEDTYRTLMAADSAVMVIDASKGVEKQTIKLFKVCVMRHIPIFTFINKMDREANDPFELLDEIESVLGISTCPVNWPIGCGKEFKGVYDRNEREVSLFKAAMNGQKEVDTKNMSIDDAALKDEIGQAFFDKLNEDVELLDGASAEFDLEKVQAGDLTPVFFGSALTNFGVETFLQHFLKMTTPPLPRNSSEGIIDPVKEDFSAFVFKIQANMNKAHRDRIAFMRICSGKFTAAKDIVNTYSEFDLYRIIRDYGEDKFAKNIAKHIVARRTEKPIETTFELNDVIKAAIPMKCRINGGHPAKRTFQAIRIELNHELDVLESSIDTMIDRLNADGRLCIITFHSLEDRIVKVRFKNNENPCTCPPDFPVCVCGKKSKGKVITRKPILPSEEELSVNSRSKSAKLRVFERAGEA